MVARPAMAYIHGLAKAGSSAIEDSSLTHDYLRVSVESEGLHDPVTTQSFVNAFS